VGGSCLHLFFCGMLSVFRGAGGGKCPEEEHTTCSGGPRIIILTSAVYGERRYFIK
jgi:hypothetical protein